MKHLICLLLIGASLSASPAKRRKDPPAGGLRGIRVVGTEREARSIAEQDTGGRAVSARRIPLNGATGGWEVDVHMPKEDRGWRCIVDRDTHGVRTKDRIPNPPLSTRRR